MQFKIENISKQKWWNIVLILILGLIPLLLMKYFDVTIVYYNNDDVFLGELVSGITTGKPEERLLHIGFLTSFFISRLYMMASTVPWYGIFLFTAMYGSIVSAFGAMLCRLNKISQKCMFTITAGYIICSFLFCHLAEIQFTTVTATVCMTSLVFFVCAEDDESIRVYLKRNILSYLFFFLAFCIREEACIMLMPTFFFVGVAKVLKNKKMYKPIMMYGFGLAAISLLVISINYIAYSPEQWKTLERYNTARSQIMDYTGFPNYEDNKEIYEECGISEQSYISLTRYQLLLDENVNAEFMEKILEIAVSEREFDFVGQLKHFLKLHTTSYIDRPLNIIVYFMYFAAICMALFAKKYKVLYDVSALFLGRMVVWAYILYIGRIMTRVTQGVYIVELMVLLAIIVSNFLWKDLKKEKSYVLISVGICVFLATIAICHRWGLPYSRNIYYYNIAQMSYATCYKEVRDYCNQNEENLYLADTKSFAYFTKDIFAEEIESKGNFVLLGAWTTNSPWTDYVAERYQIESYEEAAIMRDDVYFIIMDSEETTWQYLADYYTEKYPGSVTEIEEVLETSFGRNFFVIKVRQE